MTRPNGRRAVKRLHREIEALISQVPWLPKYPTPTASATRSAQILELRKRFNAAFADLGTHFERERQP